MTPSLDEHNIITHAWEKVHQEKPHVHHVNYPRYIVRLRHNDFFKILSSFIELQSITILEVGCGSGAFSLYLSALGNHVVALDYYLQPLQHISKGKREFEQKKHINLNLDIVMGDIRSMAFPDETFDVVFNSGVLEHYSTPKNRQEILKEMSRVTRCSGYLAIIIPNKLHTFSSLWDFLIRKFSDFDMFDLPEHSILPAEIKTDLENVGLEVTWIGAINVYDTLSLYPQWFVLRFLSYLLRVLLPMPANKWRDKFGVKILAMQRSVLDGKTNQIDRLDLIVIIYSAVPKILSPASPRPGSIYPLLFN